MLGDVAIQVSQRSEHNMYHQPFVPRLFFVAAITFTSHFASLGSAQEAQENGARKAPTATMVVEALQEARDDLSIKRQELTREYEAWRRDSPLLFTTLPPEAAMERGNRKLEQLEEEHHTIQDELRELRLQEEILKLKRKHLEDRMGALEGRKEKQIATLRQFVQDTAKDKHFRNEIARYKQLFDTVVNKLVKTELGLDNVLPATR